MPVRSTRSTAAQSDFEIRVLGTWKDGATRPFATPFTLAFSRLPARFDRDALLATPMAQVHPELMSVASNSRPLMVDQDGLGGILLQTPGAASMYRTIDGLECLRASEPLTQRTAVLVVNDPNGVARTGQTEVLPALVIQMCSGLAN